MSLVPLTFLRTSHAWHAIARYLYYLPEFFPHYRSPSPPLIFRPGRKKIFWGPGPPYLRVWMTAPGPLMSRSGSGTALVHLEGNSILDILWSLVRAWTMWFTSIFYFLFSNFCIFEYREEVVTSRCQGSNISGSQIRGLAKMAEKDEKIDLYDFPVHDCTQELNGSLYFPSIVRQCKWSSLSRKIVEIQKFCYHW